MEAIAIVGMGCRFPQAQDPELFWRGLQDGVDAITEVSSDRWDVDALYDPEQGTPGKTVSRWGGFLDELDHFDPNFFEISASDAQRIDPHQRLVLEVAWESLENAGIVPTKLVGSQTGVFIGMSQSDYHRLIYKDLSSIDAEDGPHTFLCLAANRLSYFLNLRGPSLAIDTACSSSLVAVHLACQSLRSGECNLAIAGGVSLRLSPEEYIALSLKGMLSPEGRCKTFDANADGYVRGEGCGVVVLKRLSDALKDGDNILATIRGSAVNQNGLSHGITSPNGLAQQHLIRQALENASLAPEQISFVETHGTASSLGDAIEYKALKAVLMQNREPNQPCWLGSVKSNIGHLEAAAGIASLIKVVLSLQHKQIPPNLHFKQLNPYISLEGTTFSIPTELKSWHPGTECRIAGVSSFGFGGTNCQVILAEAPVSSETIPSKMERPRHLLTLSAKTEQALSDLAAHYVERLENFDSEVSLADICFSANTGRSHFDHRLAVVAQSNQTLGKQLAAFVSGRETVGLVKGRSLSTKQPKIVFLFPGQGSQYADMGRQLYETQPTFRATINRCRDILGSYLEKPLLDILYPQTQSPLTNLLDQTAYTQPALFALEYALAQLWKSWGITPDAVMGYSVGEYVAATVAGVLTLEDALKLVAQRGRLMQSLPQKGAMVEVLANEAQVVAAIATYAEKVALAKRDKVVSIAAINSPKHIIISGEPQAVDAVVAILQTEGIQTRKLKFEHAFHSPLMEPVAAAFKQVASEVTYSSGQINIISNVTAQNATAEITTPEYWCRHIQQPVRFADSMKTLHQQGYEVFVEVGPRSLLLEMGSQCLPEGVGFWLPSLGQGQEDWQQLLHSLGTLYVQGVPVDWSGFDQDYIRSRRSLPTYPFQRQRYWFDQDANRFYQTPSSPNSASTQQLGCQVSSELKPNLEIPTKPSVKNGSVAEAQPVSIYTTSSIENWIVDWLGRNLKFVEEAKYIDNEKSGKSFLDYGLKSLGAVKLAKDLQQWLGRSLDATIIWNFPTIQSLALHLTGEIDTTVATPPLKCKPETASVSGRDPNEPAADCAKLEAPCEAKISGAPAEAITLSRVMAHHQQGVENHTQPKSAAAKGAMQFSLLYFASNEAEFTSDKYRLFLEGAKFADKYGFTAVWIPERHFHAFGGLYPNPSLLGSALAMVTERVRLRAGSVVLPLQNPIRVAEEWAVVDNLSQGRVDIAFARGWNPNDFVLAPDNFANSAEVMFSGIKTVQKLWRGESISLSNGVGKQTEIRIYPLPKQPEIPIWITCTGGKERFIEAGAIGANVLTALLFQPIEELAEKIALYRESRAKNGHNPEAGHVTLMLHTFIGEEMGFVRNKVRKPFTTYLESSVNLWRHGIKSLDGLDQQEKEHLLAYAFERYFQTSALIGTPETCFSMVRQLKAVGVDEIACLIDFGIDEDSVMASLYSLKKLKEQSESISVSKMAVPANAIATEEKSQTSQHWIIDPQPKPDARLRLFCLPYAGGDISVFRNWSNSLPPDIEVYALQLSGKTNPGSNSPFEHLAPLVEDLAQFILPYIDKDFAFYGHSLGALINFELCRYLRQNYNLNPSHFFVGAQHAPQFPYPYPSLEQLTHSELLEFVKDLTTIELSESVGENDAFLQSLLASLKAGSLIQNENYSYTEQEPIDCPITAFGGMQDKFLNQENLSAWRIHTNKSFKLQMLDGNHLFLDSHQEQILQFISQELKAMANSP